MFDVNFDETLRCSLKKLEVYVSSLNGEHLSLKTEVKLSSKALAFPNVMSYKLRRR